MRAFSRIVVGLLALAEGIAWTVFVMKLSQWHGPMAGAGDGGPGPTPSGGDELLGALLIAVIWLLPVSPYLCMAAGAFNLIKGKSLRVAYVYALVVLVLMTLIQLVSFQRIFEWMALGNIVAGGLWAYAFREKPAGQ